MHASSSPVLRDPGDIGDFERAAPWPQRAPAHSILDVFERAATRFAERPALTMLMTGEPDERPRVVSYAQLLDLIRRAANAFSALAGPRPVVAYMLPNLIETHAVLWGAECVGSSLPVNFLLQPGAIAELLRAAEADILVALGPHPRLDIWEKALEVQRLLPGLRLVRAGAAVAGDDGAHDLGALLAAARGDALTCAPSAGGDAVAAYFHTGGTTGEPKLVQHTHTNQICAAFGAATLLNLDEHTVLTQGFPMFHVAAAMPCGLGPFLHGAHVLMMSPGGYREPAMVRNYWRIVERYRVTVAGGVPTAVGAILDVALDGADISSVQLGLTGGAPAPRAMSQRWEQVTGTRLHEVLGMTETAGVVSVAPRHGAHRIGSVGFPIPYTRAEVRRLLPDGGVGEVLPAGQTGALVISGPHVSPGYRNPAHDKGVFTADGLIGGDLAYTDAEGRLFVCGRSKDLIIRSGHNIDPEMIEQALTDHPSVALAAAVGQPDVYAGELPVVYVRLRPGAAASEPELRAHAQARIDERPAWPRQIYIVDDIPLTSVGKIFKPALRLDATRRLVESVLAHELQLADADVDVANTARGLEVRIALGSDDAAERDRVRAAFEGYLFSTRVDA